MSTQSTRTPILALIASLILPGFGQLYNGQPTKGLLLFLGIAVSTPISAWLALHASKHIIWIIILIFLLISLALYIYSIVDAFRTAKRLGGNYVARPLNQAYVYIIVVMFGYLLIFGSFHYTREHLIESYYIPSQSMLPTLLQGDVIFADKRVNCLGCKNQVRHGDLAIFVYPNDRSKLYIKRVIGLPGDKIEIKDHQVKVNSVQLGTIEVSQFGHQELDQLLTTHNAWREKSGLAVYDVIWKNDSKPDNESFTVPNGKVFVMGDNRNASADSRRFGMVPIADIVGLAKQVWFSRSKTSGIRWWRIGVVVDPYY